MKVNHFAMAIVFAIAASIFFACTESSPNDPGDDPNSGGETSSSSDGSSSSNVSGVTSSDSQVYTVQCSESTMSCTFIPYTGSGTIKGTIESDDGEVLGMMDMGTVENGQVNLEFHIPEEKYNEKIIWFRLYSGDVFIGNLLQVATNFLDYDVICTYTYFPEDFQSKAEWDLFPDQDVMFVNDIDFKKGWNLYYYKNEDKDIDGKIVRIVTKSSDAAVLNGTELKWALDTNPPPFE